MSGLLSLSGTKAANDLKVNVVNTSNINLHETAFKKPSSQSAPQLREEEAYTKEVYASYPDGTSEDNPYSNLTADDIAKLRNENEALKIIINILQSNPFYVNRFIVADDVKLMELQGCITKNKYRKVHAIYVIKGGDTKNLKYDFPDVVKELTELCVSTKYVY